MQVMDELRKRQKTITGDFKSRAQKAEKILGEIEECEKKISALNESLSAVLGIGVKTGGRGGEGSTGQGSQPRSNRRDSGEAERRPVTEGSCP